MRPLVLAVQPRSLLQTLIGVRTFASKTREHVGWVRDINGKIQRPSAAQVNHHILVRRQGGESLADTIKYLKEIVKDGFRADCDTLGAVVGSDLLSPARVVGIIPVLGMQHTPDARKFAFAWSRLFANHFSRHAGDDPAHRVINVMRAWNAAQKYRLHHSLLVHILHHAGHHSMDIASEVLSIDDAFSCRDNTLPSSDQLLLYLVSFHLNVFYLERSQLTASVFEILRAHKYQFYKKRVIHHCLMGVWLADNHEQALTAILTRCNHVATEHLEKIWLAFCLARYRESYTPTMQHLRRFLDRMSHLGRPMVDFAISTFLRARIAATACLRNSAERLALGEEAVVQHKASTPRVIEDVQQILGKRTDCVRARSSLVSTVARFLTENHKLAFLLPELVRSAWENATEPQEDALLHALRGAEAAPPEDCLAVARSVFAVPALTRFGGVDYMPSADVWAQWVRCLAKGNALREGLVSLRAHVPDAPQHAETVERVLECAARVGHLRETAAFLARIRPVISTAPPVLRLVSDLSRRRAQPVALAKDTSASGYERLFHWDARDEATKHSSY